MSEPGMADVFGLLTQLVVGQQKLGADVSALTIDFGEFRSEFDRLSAEVSRLSAEVSRLSAEVGGLSADVSRLSADVSGLSADVSGLLADMSRLSAEVNKLGIGYAELRAEVTAMRAALMDRMDRLQNGLTSLREDGIVTTGMADFAHRKIDHTREEVGIIREQFNALRLQLLKVEARLREIDDEH